MSNSTTVARRSMSTAPLTSSRPAVLALAGYVALMPFLAGLPRGFVGPGFRPSELLQLAMTAGVIALAAPAVARGLSVEIRPRATDWWLAALVGAATVVPVLWLLARGSTPGGGDLAAVLPWARYGALYLVARAVLRSRAEVRVVSLAVVASALVIAAVAVAQALGAGPVVDVLATYFVSSASDVADLNEGGRGTTTIGSSIATGAYLTVAVAVALARGFATGRAAWYAVAAALAVGALASGQAGTVIGLAVVVVSLSLAYGRLRSVLAWGAPLGAVGLVALWPIVSARLADVDPGSGLPSSWMIRWVNVTELFVPSLLEGGWLLGVGPDPTVTPPDVWREIVYLESGYLALLWVGGVPLLVAAVGFLVAARRNLDTAGADPSARAARASLAMVAVLLVIDPHLTLRAGADLLYVAVAMGLAGTPLLATAEPVPARWRRLVSGAGGTSRVRTRLAEAPAPAALPTTSWAAPTIESALTVSAVADDGLLGTVEVALVRRGGRLHGVVTAADGDPAQWGPAWMAVARCGRSLRLASLRLPDGSAMHRGDLRWAARRADAIDDARFGCDVDGGDRESTTPGASALPLPVRLTRSGATPTWKRTADVVLAFGAAVATAPLWVGCAVAVRRSSSGPVLFRQLRIGRDGLPFQLYKFRTMYVDNDDADHRHQNEMELLGLAEATKDEADPRITPAGRWLRRLSLDELPQLLNVARGEMSIVGPRPSLLWEVELFEPSRRRRLQVNPGITGLWQISGRADVSMSEMLELDLAYLDGMGPALDLRCLAGTARSVVAGEGAR